MYILKVTYDQDADDQLLPPMVICSSHTAEFAMPDELQIYDDKTALKVFQDFVRTRPTKTAILAMSLLRRDDNVTTELDSWEMKTN